MGITVYYGMSGSLKLTTMECTPGIKVLSWNKTYQGLSNELLGEQPSDLTLALLRLTQLRGIDFKGDQDYLVERGITDFLEYWTVHRPGRWDPGFVEPWLRAEAEVLGESPKRVLLVMNDESFIQEKILTDPARVKFFGDLPGYLSRQEAYVQFTKHWNRVDQEIIINDANDYLMKIKK